MSKDYLLRDEGFSWIHFQPLWRWLELCRFSGGALFHMIYCSLVLSFFCLFAFFSPVASLKLTCLPSPPSSKTLLLSQGWLPLWKYHIHFAYLPKPTWLDWYLPNSFLFPLSSYVLPSKLLCYLVKSDRYNMCILYIIFWKRGLRRDHSVTASIWKITIRW